MQTPINIKIRVALTLAVAITLFATIGFSYAQPTTPNTAMTIILHGQAGRVILTVMTLAAISTAIGILLGGRYARQIAMVAIPAGLAIWSFQSSNMTHLLLEHTTATARTELFRNMFFDSMIWITLLGLGWFPIFAFKPQKTQDQTTADSKTKDRLLPLLTTLITSIIAFVLLKVIMKSGHTRVFDDVGGAVNATAAVALGQAVFGTALAFGLATFLTHQIFKKVPLWSHLIALPMVATVVYLSAAKEAVHGPLDKFNIPLLHSSITTATVMPMQLVAMGALAILAGYWYSVRTHRERNEQLQALMQ